MSKLCKRGHASSALPGGRDRQRQCYECRRLSDSARRVGNSTYRAKENARRRKRRATDPEYKARENARQVRYMAANPHQRQANVVRSLAWNRAHPECARAKVAKHYRAHPEKRNAKAARRRALKLAQQCTCCTPKQLEDFYAWARMLGCEVDHKEALALGGLHCLKNLEALTPTEHKLKTAEWDMPLIATARRLAA